MRFLGLIAALFFATSAFASQLLPPDVSANGAIAGGSDLYLIQWRCTELPRPKAGSPFSALAKALGFGTSWQGFGFYFTRGAASAPMTNSTISNVSGLLGAQVVYIVDKDASSESFYNTSCAGQLIVKGSDQAHLQVFRGRAKVTNQILQKLTDFAVTSISPFYNLLSGLSLTSRVTEIVTNSSTILKAYSDDILPLFVSSNAVTATRPLRLGQYVLRSPFANVTVTVTKPDSLLLSPAAFKSGLGEILTGGTTVTAADIDSEHLNGLRNKCNTVLQQWSPVGLKSDIDRAYVMYRAIASFAPSKEAIIKCLGRTFAFAAMPYQGKSYFDLLPDTTFDANDIDLFVPKTLVINKEFGVQPQGWADLDSTIKYVGDRAGRDLRGEQEAEFLSKFAPILRVEDETAGYSVLKELDPTNLGVSLEGAPKDVFTKLRAAGFGAWACQVATDSASGSLFKSSDRAEAEIALVPRAKDGEALDSSRAKAIRILFQGKLIRSIVFTDYFSIPQYVKSNCPPS